MGLKKLILKLLLSIEAFFLQFFKRVENRITFISLEHDQPTIDLKFIYDGLDKEKYDVRLCMIHYEKDLKGQFAYFLNCFKQLYYVYTSKVILLSNNNYVISNFKREGTVVIQVWHACGAIKRFGNAIDREYPIRNYDYVLSTSSFWKKPYSEAFGVSEEQVLTIGMPRNDELFDEQMKKKYRKKMLKKYPIIKDKKVVLYAPTFRGNLFKGFSSVPFDAKKILEALGENYVLLYKYHPLLGDIQLSDHERIVNVNNKNTHKLFCVTDFLISDYSSIVFDYMILEKPFIFYTPDLEEYMENIGVYVDVKELGYPVCVNEDEIIANIKNYPIQDDLFKKNKDKFIEYQDQYSVNRVIDLIASIIE